MILKILKGLVFRQANHPLANLACVSKEWQDFFEPLLRRTLTLRASISGSVFEGLQKLIDGPIYRSALVKKVAVLIDLGNGNCSQCENPTFEDVMFGECQRRVSAGLGSLFSMLAKWSVMNTTRGIALEIGATFLGSGFPDIRCRCPRGPTVDVRSRLDPEAGLPLKSVSVVTSLRIGRSFSAEVLEWALGDILDSLPGLQQVDCERPYPIERLEEVQTRHTVRETF